MREKYELYSTVLVERLEQSVGTISTSAGCLCLWRSGVDECVYFNLGQSLPPTENILGLAGDREQCRNEVVLSRSRRAATACHMCFACTCANARVLLGGGIFRWLAR